MIYKQPLVEGVFLKRYKRFFADVLVNGEVVVAHVPNTGSMKTCMEENATCYLTYNPDPKRKLKWTLERLVASHSQVGINTSIPNNLVFEAWQNQIVPHWKKYDRGQKEVKINKESRLDMAFWSSKDHPELNKISESVIHDDEGLNPKLHFIEVKNVTMAIDDTALFPDAVTSRGTKHIEELVKLMKLGHTCEMVFVIQRENIFKFAIAKDIDPTYDLALKNAIAEGLIVTSLKVEFTPSETKIVNTL